MKQLLTIISLCCFLATQINAQQDTTIYQVAEVQPRFPGCESLDTTAAFINACSQASLLSFINGNIVYPWAARQNGIEGMVVVSFVVEKDGLISGPKILRDIGGGCGDEAMRVLNGMNEALKDANLAWVPGMRGGQVVRTQYTLPVKFKLREPLDYSIVGLDTVYVITQG